MPYRAQSPHPPGTMTSRAPRLDDRRRVELLRFAARVPGLASGLALAVRPAGSAVAPGSRVGACAHRLGDATEGSALDAGGADPDNARRSGLAPVTFHQAIGAPGARRPARPARGARDPRCVTAGSLLRRGAGHRRGGQRPATVRYRARGSGPGCPHLRRESPSAPDRHARRSQLVKRFSVYVPRILNEIGRGRQAWRAGGAPLKLC